MVQGISSGVLPLIAYNYASGNRKRMNKSRVYVTGFSNGGAAAVALTDQYPELFAAIAPEGWMVGMRDWTKKGKEYDMPFQIIQGSKEYTYETSSGAMAIMTDRVDQDKCGNQEDPHDRRSVLLLSGDH